MKFINNIVPFGRASSRDAEDLAFLPAALEIVETPASPLGRVTAYTLMALFAIALLWACVGKVDIVASAKGKIIPSGRTKVIQPFETGVVRAIYVHDGQTVKAGETLIDLDPTMNQAESKHYESDLLAAELDVVRLHAELAEGDPLTNFVPPEGAPASLVAVQRKFLLDQTAEQEAKVAVLDRQRDQKVAERETAIATIEKLEASLPIMQERVQIRKTLFDHTTGSRSNYLELLQPFVEQQHELEVQKRHRDELTAAIAAVEQQRVQTEEEYRRGRYSDLVEAERKAQGLREDVIRAQRRTQLQTLRAPVDGTVQQLAIHTVGGVVSPAQTLLAVVPIESHLEIEAMVQNRDIGFVRAGQDAQIKVDAFNFNRYGLIEGKVESISHDAITREKPSDKANAAGKQDDTSNDKFKRAIQSGTRLCSARVTCTYANGCRGRRCRSFARNGRDS